MVTGSEGTSFRGMLAKALSFLVRTKGYKKYIVYALLITLTGSVVRLGQPEVLYRGIGAIEAGDMRALTSVGIFAGIFALVAMAVMIVERLFETYAMNIMLESVQTDLMKKSMSFTRQGFGKYKSGEMLTHISNNAEKGTTSSFWGIVMLIEGTLGLIACMVYMACLSWQLAAAVLLYNLLIRAAIRFFGRHMEAASKRFVGVSKVNNAFLVDLLNNMMTVRTFDKIRYFKNMMGAKERETLRAATADYAWDDGLNNMIWMGQKTCEYVVMYGLGGYLVYRGTSSIAMVVGFIAVAQMVVFYFNSLVWGYGCLKRAVPAIDNVNAVFQDEDAEKGSLSDTLGERFVVKCENMGFAFGDRQILSEVNLTIREKEKIMIKGANGSGKSTLLHLIAGMYRPTQGRIRFDDCNISVINLDVLARKYLYISQNSNILEGNIYENMSLSRAFCKELCEDILTKLNLENIRESKPKSLSQGEKQRLNIGRAMYRKDRACLILGDEIFANIDAANVQMIVDTLQREFADKTVIMVCHENISFQFDRVFYVEDTAVREAKEVRV